MLRVELGGARPRREPPPSQPIKRLESQLSVTLFECGGRRSRSRRPERCSSGSAVRSSPKVGERPPPCAARRGPAPRLRLVGVIRADSRCPPAPGQTAGNVITTFGRLAGQTAARSSGWSEWTARRRVRAWRSCGRSSASPGLLRFAGALGYRSHERRWLGVRTGGNPTGAAWYSVFNLTRRLEWARSKRYKARVLGERFQHLGCGAHDCCRCGVPVPDERNRM